MIAQDRNDSESGLDISELPLLTHTRVLGVDIAVSQRGIYEHIKNGKRMDRDITITAYGEGMDLHATAACRKDIAAWARRNLFNGAGPQ